MGLSMQRPTQGPSKSNVVKFSPRAPATNATLQGWKEIAAELDRSVRTVQRWERTLDLPVNKLGKGTGSPVFAFKDELHAWLRHKAEEGMKTKIGGRSKATPPRQDEESFETGRAALVKRRKNSESQTIASEPDIIKSLNAFFALKAANHNAPFCNQCHASTRLLVGHFWLYGTDRTWQVSVPFCPNCDSDVRAMLPQQSERLT